MTTAYSTNLGLALPVEGELSGTWGDMVNNGITDYLDIAVAGTLTLNGDGAVTLTDTNGDSSGTNIGSTTAQYAVLKITGTLTTTKVITAPSHSKTYIVDNSATGGTVTLKASGQSGISVAVGEICSAYFNGTDYVKVASNVADGVTTISFGSTGLTPSTATSGAVTVAGTLAVGNGGTGATSLTANNVLLGNGTSALQVVAPGTSGNVLTSNGTTWASTTPAAQSYPGAGVAVSTGSAWTTSLTAPSGALVGTTDSQTLTNKTVEAGTFTNGYTEETYTANSSTAITIDLANGSLQIITLTGSPTITMPTAVAGKSFTMLLKTGSGSYAVTWSTVKWPSDTAPTVTTTASKMDKFVFTSDGTNWYGSVAGQAYAV
jgi:hypothetical protein